MNAEDLSFFLQVARTGSLSAAARALGVEHTTVGRRVSRLERSLGVRLFDRAPSGWTATEAGRALVGPAESIDGIVRSVRDELTPSAAVSGTVRIVAPDGFGTYLLMPHLDVLRSRHPGLDVELVTATRADATRTREFDVAVTVEPDGGRATTTTGLMPYRFRLYAARAYLARHGRPATRAELAGHVLVGYVDALLDVDSLHLIRDVLPGARAAIRTTNIGAQVEAVRAGLGLALLPDYIGDRAGLVEAGGDLVVVDRSYWLVTPVQVARTRRVRAVTDALREIVGAVPARARA